MSGKRRLVIKDCAAQCSETGSHGFCVEGTDSIRSYEMCENDKVVDFALVIRSV